MSDNVLSNIISSYRAMPLWVQLWIGLILAPINSIFIFFFPHPFAIATGVAAIGVTFINGFMVYKNQGLSKVLAIPHLFLWIPLIAYAAYFLFCSTAPELPQAVEYYAWAILIINGISIAFDLVDTWEWKKGNRTVSGFPNKQPWI